MSKSSRICSKRVSERVTTKVVSASLWNAEEQIKSRKFYRKQKKVDAAS